MLLKCDKCRQNKAIDDLDKDVDELNSRVKGANRRARQIVGKWKKRTLVFSYVALTFPKLLIYSCQILRNTLLLIRDIFEESEHHNLLQHQIYWVFWHFGFKVYWKFWLLLFNFFSFNFIFLLLRLPFLIFKFYWIISLFIVHL